VTQYSVSLREIYHWTPGDPEGDRHWADQLASCCEC
jgi:hypothetical protein